LFVRSDNPLGEVLLKEGANYFCLVAPGKIPAGVEVIKRIYDKTPLGSFHDNEGVKQIFTDLAERFPKKCTFLSVANTFENREVYALRFSTGKLAPAFVFLGCHHAREWMSVEVPLQLAIELATSNDPKVADFLSKYDIWVVPILNPDGHQFSIDESRLWRKNRSKQQASTVGVDLNRNYDVHWRGEGASSNSDSDVFCGPKAFSEFETQWVRDLSTSTPIFGLISYHTFGGLILYPWGYTASTPPFEDKLAKIARGMAALSGPAKSRDTEFDYKPDQAAGLYEAAGECTDYLFLNHGTIGFTVELGPSYGSFVNESSEIEPTLKQVMPFNYYLMDAVPKDFCILYGRVTDAYGNPVTTKVRVSGLFSNIKIDPETGRFFHVLPIGKTFVITYDKQGKEDKRQLDLKGMLNYLPIVIGRSENLSLKGHLLGDDYKVITGKVTLLNVQKQKIGEGNQDGSYNFKNLAPGIYTLSAPRDDLPPQIFTLELSKDLELDMRVLYPKTQAAIIDKN